MEETPEDLSREINRLWSEVDARARACEPPAAASAGGLASYEFAWETVAFVMRQYRRGEAAWRKAMEARDRELEELREQVRGLTRLWEEERARQGRRGDED